jgi:hypothetical protein
MPRARRRRTLAETRRRRFLIILALVAMLMIGLSPLLVASLAGSAASGPGPQLVP